MGMVVLEVDLGDGVGAWFTGRDLEGAPAAVGAAGNLSHRRPHHPARLASDRAAVAERIGHPAATWVTMQQVHGAAVGCVDHTTPAGAEIRGVDALATPDVARPLAVSTADCVPVLLAGREAVAVAHAGRRGLQTGVVTAVLDALGALGESPGDVRAAIGPAIGGCCYEVPADLHDEVVADHPATAASTSWGTPALDLPRGVEAVLRTSGVAHVERVQTCTRCDPEARWFSHRAAPTAGRQFGLVVREPSG